MIIPSEGRSPLIVGLSLICELLALRSRGIEQPSPALSHTRFRRLTWRTACEHSLWAYFQAGQRLLCLFVRTIVEPFPVHDRNTGKHVDSYFISAINFRPRSRKRHVFEPRATLILPRTGAINRWALQSCLEWIIRLGSTWRPTHSRCRLPSRVSVVNRTNLGFVKWVEILKLIEFLPKRHDCSLTHGYCVKSNNICHSTSPRPQRNVIKSDSIYRPLTSK